RPERLTREMGAGRWSALRTASTFRAMRDDSFNDSEDALYRALFQTCPDSIVVVGVGGHIIRENRAARDLGWKIVEERLGRPGDTEAAGFRSRLEADGRASIEIEIDRGAKMRRYAVEATSHASYRVFVIRDVTVLRQLEEEVRQVRRLESVGYL